MKVLQKENIGLAGEYAVAFELCRRGFYAQLTLGNHKKTDILVETDEVLFRVSVKAKSGRQWPKVSGITGDDLLVFVDFQNKDLDDSPDFYVLNSTEWKKLMQKRIKDKNDGAKLDETNTIYWKPSESYPKGWRGCSIDVSQVKPYHNRWPELK